MFHAAWRSLWPRSVTFAAGLALAPGLLSSQGADVVPAIIAPDITRHVGVIAADSMQGRDTPSRGLELTAQYVAAQFERLGLMPASAFAEQIRQRRPQISLPAGEFGIGLTLFGRQSHIASWFQRYPLPVSFDFGQSAVIFTVDSQRAMARFANAARLVPYPYLSQLYMPALPAQARKVLLLAGNPPAHRLSLERDDRIVLYVPPSVSSVPQVRIETNDDGLDIFEAVDSEERWVPVLDLVDSSLGVVVLSDEDSVTFARRLRTQFSQPIHQRRATHQNRDKWAVFVRPEVVPGLPEVLAAAGVDLAQLRADTTSMVRELPVLQVAFDAQLEALSDDTTTAPNVIGVLEGSDPNLKNEYLVFTARMDHAGIPSGAVSGDAGRIGDNAAGVAGLIALAQAFSQPGARPRRSVIFVATSGGAKPGFWGSNAFIEGLFQLNAFAPASRWQLVKAVGNINLDLSGRPAQDSVAIDGLRLVELKVPPDWLAGGHPELGLTVIDGGTVFSPRADHFAFSSHLSLLLPSLNFRHGHQPNERSSSAMALDAELTARIVRLVFHVGQEAANADRPPQWTREARKTVITRHK